MGRDDRFFQFEDRPDVQQDQYQGPRITAIEALEDYSAHHAETVEDLLAWPWRRFEELYDAHAKRMALQRVTELKNAMIAGAWSNSNYDDENAREKLLNRIDEFYDHAQKMIYEDPDLHEEKIDENDPFFAAMKRPAELVNKLEVTSESVKELHAR